MFQRAATVVLLTAFASVALAGCAGDSPDTAPVDPSEIDPEQLQAGKGAIAGLLIDDRFRPIQLIDSPTTEFQARGFVLLQETGQESRTTANGEFAFIDLEPGTYTLRVSATGHEAVPSKVVVREGEFAEASIVARRTSSQGSTIVTEEYSAFSPCFINFVALSYTADCTLDQSGETFRAGITGRNVSNLADVTWIVAETQFNQVPAGGAAYDVVIRRELGYDYAAAVLFGERYTKLHLVANEVTPDPEVPGAPFEPWFVHNGTFDMLMFGRGYLAEEIRTTYEPVYNALQDLPCQDIPGLGICINEIPMRRGLGGTLGNKAQMLVSIFLGEPEVDPLVYCVICDPS